MAFCSNCGTKLNDGAKFCPKCGMPTVIKDDSESPVVVKQKAKNRKKASPKADSTSLGVWNILGLVISGFFMFVCVVGYEKAFSKFCGLLILAAIITVLIKREYRKYIGWITGISFCLYMIAGVSSAEKNKPKPFKAVADGRAAYCIDSAQYDNSDLQSIDMIVMYEGNSRKDCKAIGVNNEGHVFEENGKWSKMDAPYSSSHYYYYLDFKYFNLLIRDDSLVCYYKGDNNDKNAIKAAWNKGKIGKIRDLDGNEERAISQNVQTKKEDDKPIKGSKDLDFVRSKIGRSTWTYTPEYGDLPYWFKLDFKGSSCDVYNALPRDGEWKLYFSSPYSVVEKRLDNGKRYVFVYLKYFKNTDGSLYEPPHPTGINVTEGSFIYGAMGAIGYINERDYQWD